MNTVVDALSRIHEINMLSFTKIKSDLYDHLRWHDYHSLQETRFYDYTLQFQYYD